MLANGKDNYIDNNMSFFTQSSLINTSTVFPEGPAMLLLPRFFLEQP